MKKDGPQYTFGDSPAALLLYEKVKNNKKHFTAVGRILGKFNTIINELEFSSLSPDTMKYVLRVVRNERQTEMRKRTIMPEDVYTLCENLMAKKIRVLKSCLN